MAYLYVAEGDRHEEVRLDGVGTYLLFYVVLTFLARR